jgi:hypothetical protein
MGYIPSQQAGVRGKRDEILPCTKTPREVVGSKVRKKVRKKERKKGRKIGTKEGRKEGRKKGRKDERMKG